jgi:N-acyl-D-amino-acid deacylase
MNPQKMDREFDLLIRGGHVFNGLGTPGLDLDVAVREDRIVLIAPGVDPGRSRRVIDARGKAVSPGFIDPHSHTDLELLVNPRAESKIRQGVTTEIAGNCGFTLFPLAGDFLEEKKSLMRDRYGIDLTWGDVNGFFDALAERGTAVNYATFLGHGSLRQSVVGPDDRTARPDEIERMKELLDRAMQSGVMGLSSGLIYPPGMFAPQEELIALCSVVSHWGGIYTTHMRDEGDFLAESVEEAIAVARASGVSLQLSHLKLAYPRNWPKVHQVLSRISEVRAHGLDILADRYPYTATSTFLSVFFPRWIKDGSTRENLIRIRGTDRERELREHLLRQEEKLGSWDNIQIASVLTEKSGRLVGKTILQAARDSGRDPFDFILDLVIQENDQVGMINFSLNEETFKRIILHPLVVIGSDGWALAPYGLLSRDIPAHAGPLCPGRKDHVPGKGHRENDVPHGGEVRAGRSGADPEGMVRGHGRVRSGPYHGSVHLGRSPSISGRDRAGHRERPGGDRRRGPHGGTAGPDPPSRTPAHEHLSGSRSSLPP